MSKLPKEIKLTAHAKQRLEERKDIDITYNTKNLMKSSCKWYRKEDLIHDEALYRHCCYVTRKSNQMGYLTDGKIEVLYNKGTGVAITILEMKDKFKPITQYIKPEVLKQIEKKKEEKKMKKIELKPGICQDCGKETEIDEQKICVKCKRRKINARARGKEYIPYINLSEDKKRKVDSLLKYYSDKAVDETEDDNILKAPDNNSYYVSKANQTEISTHPMPTIPITIDTPVINSLLDQSSFVQVMKNNDACASEEELQEILSVLLITDKLKDIFMTITKNNNRQAILNLEQTLDMVEKKLQTNWELNGFQEADDMIFKGFLTWRRMLKESIEFWKKASQTNLFTELQKIWNIPVATPTAITTPITSTVSDNSIKKYQITTESISTIYNTKRPFTRVFYSDSKENAYKDFVKWLSDRQLHEDKSKTVIVELSADNMIKKEVI